MLQWNKKHKTTRMKASPVQIKRAVTEKKRSGNPANRWVIHVQKYKTEFNVSYKDALKAAGETYTKSPSPTRTTKRPDGKNPWMLHIDEWKKEHPDWKDSMVYKDVLKVCKETYKA